MKRGNIIAIEGVIGVGKTTLAHALGQALGAELLLESDIRNPFLDGFYRDRTRYALACQLCFLDGRLAQLAHPRRRGPPVICDYILEKDWIFADINLADDEWDLYQRYHARLVVDHPFRPDVTIYLKASPDEVRARIRRRGRPGERRIGREYLDALVDHYDAFFDTLEDRAVVVVDTDTANVAQDPAALERLIAACNQAPRGVSYCNPVVDGQ